MNERADGTVVLVATRPAAPAADDVGTLSALELERLRTFVRPADAAAFATGRALLRRALGERLACAPGAVLRDSSIDPALGPAVETPGGQTCSISHGGRIVVVAVAPGGAIGVDVEPLETSMTPDEAAEIARDLLGAPRDEVAGVRSGVGRSRRSSWVDAHRGAVLKAVGTGFTRIPGPCTWSSAASAPASDPRRGVPPEAASRWQLRLLDVAPEHVVALAGDATLRNVVVSAGVADCMWVGWWSELDVRSGWRCES